MDRKTLDDTSKFLSYVLRHQPEAIGLYERCGFRRRPPFGEYREDPNSVYFEKSLP